MIDHAQIKRNTFVKSQSEKHKNCHLLIIQPFFFSREISVTDSQTYATKSFFFSLYCDIHENLVPTGSNPGFFTQNSAHAHISSVTQDGVPVLVVNCLSFRNVCTLNVSTSTRLNEFAT